MVVVLIVIILVVILFVILKRRDKKGAISIGDNIGINNCMYQTNVDVIHHSKEAGLSNPLYSIGNTSGIQLYIYHFS